MAEFDNTNRGVLFNNDRKEKDTQPDRTGTLNVEGVEYFFDGWLKKSRDGKTFLSVSVKRKDKQPTAAAPAAAPAPAPRAAPPAPRPPPTQSAADWPEDDIPF